MSTVCPNCNAEKSAFDKMFTGDYCVRCSNNLACKEVQNLTEENEMLKKNTKELKKSLEELEDENKKLREVMVEKEELQKQVQRLKKENTSLIEDRQDVEKCVLKVLSIHREMIDDIYEDFEEFYYGGKLNPLEYLTVEVIEFKVKEAILGLSIKRKRNALANAKTNEEKNEMATMLHNDLEIERLDFKGYEAKWNEWEKEKKRIASKLDKEQEAVEEAEMAKEQAQKILEKLEKMEITEQENVKAINNLNAMVKDITLNATIEKTNADEKIQMLEKKLEDKMEEFEKFKKTQEKLIEHAEIEKKLQEKTITKLFDENVKRAGESKLQEYLFNELQGKYNALKAEMEGSA